MHVNVNVWYVLFQMNGQDISWQHLVRLFERHCTMKHAAPGLSILPRLRYEHLHLTSYSKMRVDLAAQVRHYAAAHKVISFQ